MTSNGWGRPYRFWIWLIAAAALAVASHARPAAAEELTVIRLRPTPMPFVQPSGVVVRRIVHFLMTMEKEGARAFCGRLPEAKSAILVSSFNRRMESEDWTPVLAGLARDLFLVLDRIAGPKVLRAMHVALDSPELEQERRQSKNQIQKRLEQVEDCTTVKSLPPGAVTVTRSEVMGQPEAPVASAPPQSIASTAETSSELRPTPSPADLPPLPSGPFVTHPQMVDKPGENLRMGATVITGTTRKGRPGRCNFEVTDIWQSRWVVVSNVPMWIERVFTVDADANEKVDDVGFILRRENGAERQVSYYDLHPPGSHGNIAGLTLPDPEIIPRLCPGSHEFEPPGDPTKAPAGLKVPNLASEVANRFKREADQEPEAKPAAEPSGATSLWRWIAAAIAFLGALLAAAVLAYFVIRARRDRRGGSDRRDKERRKGKERRNKDKGRAEGDRRAGERRDEESQRRAGARRTSAGRRDEDDDEYA